MIKRLQLGEVNLLLAVAIFFGIGTVLFGTLAVFAYQARNRAETTLNKQVATAKQQAADAQRKTDIEANRKAGELPYRVYTADQVDGGFELQLPKNWSLYAQHNASSDTQLTLLAGPDVVNFNISGKNTQPFRAQLLRTPIITVLKSYEAKIKKKTLASSGQKVSGIDATRLEGVFDEDHHDGVLVVVPVRDKTLVLFADSRLYLDEFNKIVASAKIIP